MDKKQNDLKPLWYNAFEGESSSNSTPVKNEKNFLSHSEFISESVMKKTLNKFQGDMASDCHSELVSEAKANTGCFADAQHDENSPSELVSEAKETISPGGDVRPERDDREGLNNEVQETHSPVCKADILSKGEVEKKSAFTLAEAMIVMIALGVIAAVSLPSLLERKTYNENMTKVKKAIADYEKVVSTMHINEGLTTVEGTDATSLNGWANNDANCTNGKSYFKIKNDLGNCKFTTADDLYWDISTMSKPVISISEKDVCRSADKVNVAKDDVCYNKTFYLTTTQGSYEQGNAFIVNSPDTDAKYALYFAKMIDSTGSVTVDVDGDKTVTASDFQACKNTNADTCIIKKGSMNYTYTKKEFADASTNLSQCYNPDTGETVLPCKSTATAGEHYVFDTGVRLNYNDAKAYCENAGGRLPTYSEIRQAGFYGWAWASEEYDSSTAHTGVQPTSKTGDINVVGCIGD